METENYIWENRDMLGKGASGSVYKARCKLNGEIVAVKVLNLPYGSPAYYNRALEMQQREIDIMKRYNHKNIVKLVNVEKLLVVRQSLTVIVMEMCTGGSLHDILEKPQNWKGLEETLFCQVLFDLASAMEYLRSNQIVHRDIKPLNIMCQIDDNGRSTFKLIDFGAARHLPENLQFTSIVGTEEYLHPDIYKRGVLRDKNAVTDFDECVDLWSVGVTLYQAAVGDLPFKPYEGVRNDHQTMNNMISKKPRGSISAAQLIKNGPINWSSELPDECNLSRGLKNLLTPLLRGLLSSKEEGWSFEKFFEITTNMKQRIVFFVFDTTSSKMERIYANPEDKLVNIKEHIAQLTNTSAAEQILLFENLEFESIYPSMPPPGDGDMVANGRRVSEVEVTASMFPKTWQDNPIFMFGLTMHTDVLSPQLYQVLTEEYQSKEDYPYVLNMHLKALYCNQRVIFNLILRQRLIIRAAKMYQLWFEHKVGEAKDDIVRMDSLLTETCKRIELSMTYCDDVQRLLEKSSYSSSSPTISIYKNTEAKEHFKSYQRQNRDLDLLRVEMETLCRFMFENPMHWINQTFCNAEDACEDRIKNSLNNINKMKTALDNWKKFEKLEMERISRKTFAYINSHCIPRP